MPDTPSVISQTPCFILLIKNIERDVEGVKKMIQIGCCIIGSLEAVISSIMFICGIAILCSSLGNYGIISGVFVVAGRGLFLLFSCLLLQGIRTHNPEKRKPWTIFKIVILCIQLCCSISGWIFVGMLHGFCPVIASIFTFLYFTGMVIVHFNFSQEEG